MLSSLSGEGVPEPTMIGRERELRLAESAFDDAKRNRVPAIVRIAGESGIGKTFFLSRLAHDLESKGWFVVQTTCHAIQKHTPRLVANRIVAQALALLGSEAARYTSGLEEVLATFDGAIARAIGSSPSAHSVDSDTYVSTFLRIFEGIAVDHDVALLCDDAQWADAESARALLALPQKISTGCVSLTVAERSEDEGSPRKWFPSTDIRLLELAVEDSLRLIASELPDIHVDTAEMLAHHAGGRPIELVTLCESVRSGQATNVERSFRGRIAHHLSLLEPELREFVQLCALLSDPLEQRILLQLYSNPSHLERLIERAGRYVAIGKSGLAFRHAMLAQNVASTIAVPIPLHKRIIAALESLPSLELTDYERIAKHAAACGDRIAEAEACLRLVKEASAQEAWGMVIAASERALALRIEAIRTPDILANYILALRAYDREPEAVECLTHELPLIKGPSSKGLGRIVSMLIIMLVELERVDQATAVYRKYIDELTDPDERLGLIGPMKYGALNSANDDLFAELEVKLESLSDETRNRVAFPTAGSNAGYASLNGDAQRAREIVASALAYANPNHPRRIYLLEFASLIYDFRHIGLKPLSARLPGLNAAYRKSGDILYGNTCEVWEAFFKGDWESALRGVGDYYREEMPVPRAAALLSIAAAIAALTNGHTIFSEDIGRVCSAALERSYRQSAMQLLPWWLLSSSDAALDKFARDITADLATRPPPISALGYFPAGFALWASSRSHTDLLRFITSIEATRDRSNWARAHWSLTRGLAMLALNLPDAKLHLGDAAEGFRTLSTPFFAAYAAHYAGTAAPEEKQLLAKLGVAKSKSAGSKRSATDLTPREWEVARLVRAGASNRQIAEKLFLSERTVEVHLGNIFGKLNLSSRAQLVRWLYENETAS